MKKFSTILLSMLLILTMTMSLTGCGKITLSSKTINQLTIDVPSDFGDFQEKNETSVAMDKNSTCSIAISKVVDAQGTSAADWDKDTFQKTTTTGFTDVKFIEFDNKATIANVPAVLGHYTAKNSSGVAVEIYNYMIYRTDGKFQSIALSYTLESDSSLKNNLDTIKKSIKLS